MTRKAIPLDALRCCRGVFWQNPFLRPDIPVSTGLITAKFLSAPRCPGIDGAYSSKISQVQICVYIHLPAMLVRLCCLYLQEI